MVYNLITSFTSEEVVLQSELYSNLEQKTCQFIIIYYMLTLETDLQSF